MKHRLFIAYIAILLAFCLPLHTRTVDEAGKVLALPQKAPVALSASGIQPIAEIDQVDIPVIIDQASCGDNEYAQFIYQHESGCRTNAVNEIGACGIGQAWPCEKMPCTLYDYECQNQFFTSYMVGRYGSWELAYDYWVAHSNW